MAGVGGDGVDCVGDGGEGCSGGVGTGGRCWTRGTDDDGRVGAGGGGSLGRVKDAEALVAVAAGSSVRVEDGAFSNPLLASALTGLTPISPPSLIGSSPLSLSTVLFAAGDHDLIYNQPPLGTNQFLNDIPKHLHQQPFNGTYHHPKLNRMHPRLKLRCRCGK